MLLVLYKVGLVWGIRLPRDLAMRPELRALDSAALASPPLRSPSFADTRRLFGTARRADIHSEGPAALLSAKLLRRLLGGFTHPRSARRLSVCAAGLQLAGLPAVCVALAARSDAAMALAALALPPAFAAERVRQWSRYG